MARGEVSASLPGMARPPGTASLSDDELVPALDAALREAYRQRPHRYPPLSTGIVKGIQRLHAEGTPLSTIAALLNRHGYEPWLPGTHRWSPVDVRIALAVASVSLRIDQ